MCTVSFIARQNGYALGMNRDEKLSRVRGLPPSRQVLNGRTAAFPSEPGGGTWIGVNDAGAAFALINWYSVPTRVFARRVSRGHLVRAALAASNENSVEQVLAEFPLIQTNPFRLIGVFHDPKQVVEWQWNLCTLRRVAHDWKTNVWISSGFDEAGAQKTRRLVFDRFIERELTHDQHWLRAFHASHVPKCGPYSVCMHREDGATVSYTEVLVGGQAAELRYSPGPLCCHRVGLAEVLHLRATKAVRL